MAKKTTYISAVGKFWIGGNLYEFPDGRYSLADIENKFGARLKEAGLTAKNVMDVISAITVQQVDRNGNIIETERPVHPFKLEVVYEDEPTAPSTSELDEMAERFAESKKVLEEE